VRLFFARPSSVVLVSIGCVSPSPFVEILLASIPFLIKYLAMAAALLEDNSRF